MIVMSHQGQHGDDCHGCQLAAAVAYKEKLRSLTFDRGRPKTHVKHGNPWDGNPVAERIQELSGVAINTDIPPAGRNS